jgi:hypothetical protein
VKIASFNVENMFRRAVVLNQNNWKDGKPILEAYAALTEILEQPVYSDADKGRILNLLEKLGLLSWDEKRGGKRPGSPKTTNGSGCAAPAASWSPCTGMALSRSLPAAGATGSAGSN